MIQAIRYKKNDIKSELISGRLFLVAQIIIVACYLLLVAPIARAVVLYLEPDSGEYGPGNTFLVDIKIDSEKECINVVEANLNFSNDTLKAVDFSTGESILILWLKNPVIDQEKGEISFIGGIPGEYCGEIPGNPGPSNLLGKIVFKVSDKILEPGKEAQVIFLDTSQVLKSDTSGSNARVSTRGANFKISMEPGIPEDRWQEMIKEDIVSPEPFKIEVRNDPLIFEGKYFIIFFTTDKQTGLDRFEVKEGNREWKRAESPYLLEDQTLQSEILVKAVDKAGNERMAKYSPVKISKKEPPYEIMILILVGIGTGYWIYKKLRIKYKNDNSKDQKNL